MHFTREYPENTRESEGLSSSAGEKAGRPPGHSEARCQHKPRRDGERFGERKGTHRNAWFPSSLRENDVGSAEAPLVKEYHILRQCNHFPIQRDIFIP